MILAIFDLQVTPILPIKFGVNGTFYSGEETQNRFSKWQPSCISYRGSLLVLPIIMILAIFDLRHLNDSYQVSSLVQEKKLKLVFQNGHHGGHHGSHL